MKLFIISRVKLAKLSWHNGVRAFSLECVSFPLVKQRIKFKDEDSPLSNWIMLSLLSLAAHNPFATSFGAPLSHKMQLLRDELTDRNYFLQVINLIFKKVGFSEYVWVVGTHKTIGIILWNNIILCEQ